MKARSTLCLLCAVALVSLPAGGALGQETTDWTTTQPFDWHAAFASPGTSLRIEEAARSQYGEATLLEYRFVSTGFEPDDEAEMWMKQGPAYRALPAVVGTEGEVVVAGADIFMVAGYVRGQALDVALVSGGKRAQAKLVPFPIESAGDGCRISIELVAPDGTIFLVAITGFEVGESVRIESLFKDQHVDQMMQVPADGSIDLPLIFEAGQSGTATLRVTGLLCTASVEYGVGEEALAVQ